MDELDKKIKHLWNKIRKPEEDTGKESCPEDIMLFSYIGGVLGETDKEKVEKHLLKCSHCLDLVLVHNKVQAAETHEAISEAPGYLKNKAMSLVAGKDAGEGLFDIVLKFARETIEIITNPANLGISHMAVPVPVRGEQSTLSSNLITLNKTFSDTESVVEVMRVAGDLVSIRTLITDIESGEPVEGLRISLFNPHREIASYIAKKGEALFEDLRFGKYIVKIHRQGREIGHISLDIKE